MLKLERRRDEAALPRLLQKMKSVPLGVYVAVVLLISGIAWVSAQPAPLTLEFDGSQDQPLAFNERGPTRLLVRMTGGERAQIVSVSVEPADSVRILTHPGACAPNRTLTMNVPVCALWIEPGPLESKDSARVRVAYRAPGKTKSYEVVQRLQGAATWPAAAPKTRSRA